MAAKVADIAKATAQYLNFAEESAEPSFQGWRFIDFTLLCVHCPAFSKLTEKEAIELVKALDFEVLLPEKVEDEDIVEPTFSLNILWDEDKLKSEVEEFIRKEL